MSAATLVEAPAPPRGRDGGRVWLVADGPAAERVADQLGRSPDRVPTPSELSAVLAWVRPGDRAVVAGLTPAQTVRALEALLARGLGVAVDATEAPALRRALGRRIGGLDCVVLRPAKASRLSAVVLRLRDVAVAAGALAALSPLLALIALLVKRSSPGPVFFATHVVGRDGVPFLWRKFRTMRVAGPEGVALRRERYRAFIAGRHEAGADRQVAHKIVDESRVTAVGRVLRRHSLDELPQFWNVLRGDMTLVGPRPCQPYEYDLQDQWHRLRYRVKPGLTGPWQAYGRSQVTFDEMVLMDYCYSYARSFWLDARLIARTVVVVLTGEGGK